MLYDRGDAAALTQTQRQHHWEWWQHFHLVHTAKQKVMHKPASMWHNTHRHKTANPLSVWRTECHNGECLHLYAFDC